VETLGEKLSSLRKSRGVSQELLAENSKVSLRTIQRIEGNLTTPRPYTLKVIADALGVPVDFLGSAGTVSANEGDVNTLRIINFSALTVCLIPLANLVIPFILWKKNKATPLVDKIGRRIINFQILWTIVTIVILLVAQVLIVGLTGTVAIGRFPPTVFLVYAFMIVVNIVYVLHASIHLRNPDEPGMIYPIAPSFF
jgi:transcriptional regulator with XRE-family HTH domain